MLIKNKKAEKVPKNKGSISIFCKNGTLKVSEEKVLRIVFSFAGEFNFPNFNDDWGMGISQMWEK
jgi:hypothetical protein